MLLGCKTAGPEDSLIVLCVKEPVRISSPDSHMDKKRRPYLRTNRREAYPVDHTCMNLGKTKQSF